MAYVPDHEATAVPRDPISFYGPTQRLAPADYPNLDTPRRASAFFRVQHRRGTHALALVEPEGEICEVCERDVTRGHST